AAELAIQFAQIGKDVKGQYILRWATLKRTSKAFMPSFNISYQSHTAFSPTNPVTPGSTNIDETVDPPVTNMTEAVTNYIIGWFTPTEYSAPVTKGALRLVPDAEVLPTSVSLRLAYAPRYIRQLRIQYRANWPCTVSLQSTNTGELMSGWSLTQTTDDTGAAWLLLSSPNPQSLATSIPFAGFGKLLTFSFKDVINPSNAFSLLAIDNDVYTNTGGQSFEFENGAAFTANHPALPFGTPPPWLLQFGFSGDLAAAELADPDADGIPTWQEYRADTKPNDPASALRVQSFSQDPYGRYTVTFPTSAYRSYTVLVSTDLTNWEVVQDNIPGTGTDVTAVDKYRPGATSLFYCVQVQ
ncbi:MAG TPA: hypothetical protein VN673_12700, partial [Clostridia bacterium]|nr:hypothetical protein [Clostridia bacterium]